MYTCPVSLPLLDTPHTPTIYIRLAARHAYFQGTDPMAAGGCTSVAQAEQRIAAHEAFTGQVGR